MEIRRLFLNSKDIAWYNDKLGFSEWDANVSLETFNWHWESDIAPLLYYNIKHINRAIFEIGLEFDGVKYLITRSTLLEETVEGVSIAYSVLRIYNAAAITLGSIYVIEEDDDE